tara:strand:+ start:41 stop:445 length:405 start_codon:yes stop_codon:yes gene_type:complete
MSQAKRTQAPKSYVYPKAVKAIKHSQFNLHKHCDSAHISKRAQWQHTGFRGMMLAMWPYRYFLIVVRQDPVDWDSLITPCCFNLQAYSLDSHGQAHTKHQGTMVIGFTRQVDRNRQAKRMWQDTIGWAGGEFVY